MGPFASLSMLYNNNTVTLSTLFFLHAMTPHHYIICIHLLLESNIQDKYISLFGVLLHIRAHNGPVKVNFLMKTLHFK
jgi:desulfoferrodoxin (superoxide reductase-like protein)